MSSSAKLYPPSKDCNTAANPLPQLLQTPSGLALLELQGAFNLPRDEEGQAPAGFEIGKLDFPDYTPGTEGTAWMQTVHLYVGQHQRLTGEIKKLPKAIAIVRRREGRDEGSAEEAADSLEVVEVVKHKLMFSSRPEPVGTANAS